MHALPAMTVLAMPCWFYDKAELKRSPSILDGIDMEKESRYRREGARFIINVGTKMGLRYDTMATGVVYFHRFYMFHSFKTFPRFISACCCLFLAGKVEETPKKCKDIIRIAKTFLTDAQFAQFGDDPKEEVMTLERILLQTIKFDLQVDHPYGYLLKYAKCLRGDQDKLQNMVQMAWTFINDSLCTTLCLQWEPEVIAIALMYLAGKLSKFEVVDWNGRTPKHSCWWDMYVEGMSKELLEDICHQVLDLYSTPVPDTPQDSPPATPPSKSTIKKVLPVQNITSPNSAPVSPVPVPKLKDVPVGQPIPRLEPGELKRKAAKVSLRKDSTEGKLSRQSVSASKVKMPRLSSSSPKSLQAEDDAAAVSIDLPAAAVSSSSSNNSNSSNNQLKATEPSYPAAVAQYTIAPASDVLKAAVTQASSSTAQNQFPPPYSNRPMTFLTPEPGVTYFSSGQAPTLQSPFGQNAPYLTAQNQPSLPTSNQPQQLTNIQQPPCPPLPPPPTAAVAPAAPPPPPYPSQGPPTQFPPPPQMHNVTSVGQYPPPAQPPTNVVLPNVSLPPPPPTPPNHLSQPPPMPMPPNMTQPPPPRAPMPPGMPHNSAPMPPVLPPPSQLPPHHFPPRPEHDRLREHPPGARMAGPMQRPPRFFHEGPPQDFVQRSHYEQDRLPMPPMHFRGPRDGDFDRERMREDRYSDYGCGPPGYGRDFDSPMPPFRRYSLERGPPPPGPRMKNPPPLMETPTGIPPVRITGSGYHHPMS